MKKLILVMIVLIAVVSANAQNTVSLGEAVLIGDEIIETPYGNVEIQHNLVTDKSSQILFDAMDLQRASQAYMWSTPLVGFQQMKNDLNASYGIGKTGEFVILQSLKEKRGVVTGNLTTPYIFQFVNLSNGAMEIEYPDGLSASAVMDFWQRPVADMGLTGIDGGKGGTYIIVAPGDDASKYERKGVNVFQSATNNVLIGIRLVDPSKEYAEKFKATLKMGIVGQEKAKTIFVENLDVEWSGTVPRGLKYWEVLHEILAEEPVREQDKVWNAMLEPLGIDSRVALNLNERQSRILTEGAALGELMLRNMQINPRFAEIYWENTQWYKSFDFTVPQMTDYKVELDERSVWYYEAITSSEGMVNPKVGQGQVYMTAKRDANGDLLRADKTYVLHVPSKVAAEQFWSIILYSENTRRPYDNGGKNLSDVGLNSRMEQLQYNKDGSVDIFIGNKAPKGMKSNHIQTIGEDGWFVYFRLYAPTQEFFDKTFKLPDFEVVK